MSIIVDALKKAEEIKKRRQDEAKESASELRSLSSSTVTAELKPAEIPEKQTEEPAAPENIQEKPVIPEQVSFKKTENKITSRKPLIVLFSLVSVLVVCIFVFIFFGTVQWLDKINLVNFSSAVSPSQKPPPAIIHTAPVTPPQQAPQAPTVTASAAPASAAEQPPVEKRTARSRKMPEFRLTGIYTMEGVAPYAFINGKVVKVGDNIMGAEVQIIKSDLVVLKHKNRDIVLTME